MKIEGEEVALLVLVGEFREAWGRVLKRHPGWAGWWAQSYLKVVDATMEEGRKLGVEEMEAVIETTWALDPGRLEGGSVKDALQGVGKEVR